MKAIASPIGELKRPGLGGPVIFVGCHLIESNLITPALVGRRLTINPLLILIALSFWSWVWGPVGALLAVPLLIIGKTVLDAAGKPDIAGFLFEEGTLTNPMPEQPADAAFPVAEPVDTVAMPD